MSDAIFLRAGAGLVPMTNTPYDEEKILQQVLEDYPSLIAGMGTAGDAAALLLIRREMPVGGAAGHGGLSLDHLFVDSSGVPVLVEVKRSSDTRARREVVAQMLDYAANGTAYWKPEVLKAEVARTAAARGVDGDALLQEVLSIHPDDAEGFWWTVEDNLRKGRVRLIFLADRLTPELIRIIEFLNEQMRETEVLGIELPQYVGKSGEIVYVPRLVGRTSAAVGTKRGVTTPWNQDSLLEQAAVVCAPDELALLNRLFQHVRDRGGRFSWGTGNTPGVTGWYVVDSKDTPVWNVNIGAGPSSGRFYFIFGEYATRHPASSRLLQYEAAAGKLPALAGKVAEIKQKNWKGWAGASLSAAASETDGVIGVVNTAVG